MSEGRHDVGAGAGVGKRGLGQPLERGVVIHVVVFDETAVAVAGVFAIADVGDDQQLGGFAAHGADGVLHDAVVGVGAGGHFVLGFRQAEQDHAADAERLHFGALLHQFVNGQLIVAGHGADFAAHAFARADEQGQDELRRMEPGFAHQRTDALRRPQAAETVDGKRHHPDCNAPAPRAERRSAAIRVQPFWAVRVNFPPAGTATRGLTTSHARLE